MLKLYSYFRSSASYRVRIALNLKQLAAEQVSINLLKSEQKSESFRAINPQGLVPALVTEEGALLTQSLAIMEYVDEVYLPHPLLPKDALGRARVRALCQAIACEMAPLNNLRVLQYLTGELKVSEDQKNGWYKHWISEGFDAVEKLLAESASTGKYCHGDIPGMADACLVPQVFNAKRFGCDMSSYPTINRITEACEALPAFTDAHPSKQPDSV